MPISGASVGMTQSIGAPRSFNGLIADTDWWSEIACSTGGRRLEQRPVLS